MSVQYPITYKKITWAELGNLSVQKIIDNIQDLIAGVNDLESKKNDLETFIDQYNSIGTISYAVGAVGIHTALESRKHPDIKLDHIFAVVGGTSEVDTKIDILMDNGVPLADTIQIKSSYSKGKIVIGSVIEYIDISRIRDIQIESDSNQLVSVHMNFVPVER